MFAYIIGRGLYVSLRCPFMFLCNTNYFFVLFVNKGVTEVSDPTAAAAAYRAAGWAAYEQRIQ